MLRAAGDGSCEFSIRHPSLGWVACMIPLVALVSLADLLKRLVPNQDEGAAPIHLGRSLSRGDDD